MTTSGAPAHSPESAGEKARRIHAAIPAGGLFFEKEWRISPEPMRIDAGLQAEFLALGGRLLRFYRALNDLYYASAEGAAPASVAQLLD
ncbi:MAG: hypothetical protein JO317_04595, partial [Verrucomicrobiae bacterium]|nr:hypothetical protein [Verrucomicrobiae bacterium]